MIELVGAVVLISVMSVLLALVLGRFDAWERPWLWGSLGAHFASAVAEVLVFTKIYGYGDMLRYGRIGSLLARFLMEYPVEGSLRLIQVIFRQPGGSLPVPLRGDATGAMEAISGFVMLAVGDSIYGACLFFGGLTFFSSLLTYRVFRRELPQNLHRAALIGCLWVPSVVFWSSALLKEPVAVTGLGMAIYGGHAFATRRRLLVGAVLFVVGCALVAAVKAYLLLPLGIAAGVWIYLDGPRPAHRRRLRQIRPGALLIAVVLSLVFVIGVGELFPSYSPTRLAEEAAETQADAARAGDGGSDYEVGNPAARGLAQQLAFAPLGVLTALFRPTLLDVRNPMTAVNALETTIITVFLIMGLLRTGPFRFIREVFQTPILAFCTVYVLGLALGVGLATSNLGTLSRYRIPLMPFFVVVVAVMAHPQRRPRQSVALPVSPGPNTLQRSV